MKFRRLLAIGTGLAAALLAVAPAQAAVNYAGQYTYLGAFVPPPGTPSSDFFGRNPVPVGAFGDYWIFDFAPPGGGASFSVNFVPPGSITGFTGQLFNASGFGCGAAGTVCTAGAIGSLVAGAGVPTIGFPGVSIGFLAAGQYAILVSGTNSNASTSYSGQVAFDVPEPASVGLAGLGLLALGAMRRRRRA